MTLDQNHYKVLEVPEDASASEIEDAFYRKVREHPPEQDPEGHERLQEAKRVLLDEELRKEYDAVRRSGGKVGELKEEAERLVNRENPDYETAIKKLKKAVVLAPELELLRNQLGQVYFQNDQPQEALEQFDEALELSEDPPAGYFASRGQALEKLGRLEESEQDLRRAWRRDSGNYEFARILAQVFHRQGKVDEALEVLDRTIWADDKLDFEDFICYHAKLQIYVAEGKMEMLEDELETVKDLPETQDDREYAAFMLGQTGQMLLEGKAYKVARKFMEVAVKLDPGNPRLKADQKVAQEGAELKKSLEEVANSSAIHDFVKHIVVVFYESYVGAISAEEAEQKKKEIMTVLQNMMEVDPENTEIKQSIRRIRRKYPDIFEMNEEAFQAILSMDDASFRADDCPHCGDPVRFEKGTSVSGTCGGCNKPIKIEGNEVKNYSVEPKLGKKSSGSDTSTSKQGEKSSSNKTSAGSRSSPKVSPPSSDNDHEDSHGQKTGYSRGKSSSETIEGKSSQSSTDSSSDAGSSTSRITHPSAPGTEDTRQRASSGTSVIGEAFGTFMEAVDGEYGCILGLISRFVFMILLFGGCVTGVATCEAVGIAQNRVKSEIIPSPPDPSPPDTSTYDSRSQETGHVAPR